jgi:hypothetical protein
MAKNRGYNLSVEYGAVPSKTLIIPSAASTPSSEFESFRALAGRLVKVPKSELDEEREKS